MIEPLDKLLVGFCVAAGALMLLRGIAGLGPVARLLFTRTTPLDRARAGRLEVSGDITARGAPLVAHDGAACVAIWRRYSVVSVGSKGSRSVDEVFADLQTTDAALSDARGSITVDLDQIVLLGNDFTFMTNVAEVGRLSKNALDAFHARGINDPETLVRIDETCLPTGTRCVVSGEAAETTTMQPGPDYRTSTMQMRLFGEASRPMIVGMGGEGRARRRLLAMTSRYWMLALAWWFVGWAMLGYLHGLARIARFE